MRTEPPGGDLPPPAEGRRVAGMVATMTYATTVVVIYAPGVIGVLMLAAAGFRRKAR